MKVYRFILRYKEMNQNNPTYDEIRVGAGLGSTRDVWPILEELEAAGKIALPHKQSEKGKHRALFVVGGRFVPPPLG